MSRSSPTYSARRSGQAVFFSLYVVLVALAFLPFTARSATPLQAPLRLDVPYVPTPPDVVAKMLEMADVKPSDFLIDLGAGDGRIAVAAVRDRGAKGAFGVDINPERVKEARENAQQARVADKVKFAVQDLFETDFSKATVVSMYLLPNVNLKLRPKILAMTPGTRVVSHAFDMDEWEPDAHVDLRGRDVYLWVVPAKVAGQWQFTGPEGNFTVDLRQEFQKVTGTATAAGKKPLHLTGAMRGDVIHLAVLGGAAPQSYVGRVQGDTIVALAEGGAAKDWRASRR
jgi:SAM-dependent methyltransferase